MPTGMSHHATIDAERLQRDSALSMHGNCAPGRVLVSLLSSGPTAMRVIALGRQPGSSSLYRSATKYPQKAAASSSLFICLAIG